MYVGNESTEVEDFLEGWSFYKDGKFKIGSSGWIIDGKVDQDWHNIEISFPFFTNVRSTVDIWKNYILNPKVNYVYYKLL